MSITVTVVTMAQKYKCYSYNEFGFFIGFAANTCILHSYAMTVVLWLCQCSCWHLLTSLMPACKGDRTCS